jgi:hypothetical protein
MHRERLDNQVYCSPDSVATATTPPGSTSHEKEFSDTDRADQIRTTVRSTIKDLNVFPSGVRFPDVVFFETAQYFTGPHNEPGKIIATVDKTGVMSMIKALRRNMHDEWELEGSGIERYRASDAEATSYALPLMTIARARSIKALMKSVFIDRAENKPSDSRDTVCLTNDLANIDNAIQTLVWLKPAPASPPHRI